MHKIIGVLFGVLFFLVPLVLWPTTSEVFEFNKIVVTYTLTTLITTTWIIRMIIGKKTIFRRTLLDLPLLAYLTILLFSTLFSIDIHTSLFGYYSRFNGGFLSIICYSLLYWAFVSNMNARDTKYAIRYTLISAVIVSIYGIMERFGIDKNIWVQDVQNRVFSTLGQPNWLAAFLIAVIPLTWTDLIKKPFSYILSVLFFVTLLFTKSRSGLLGFAVVDIVFWGILIYKSRSKFIKEFAIFNSIFLILFLIFNPLKTLTIGLGIETGLPADATRQALQAGGTESGTIRKIVWRGAFEIWKHYPTFGTGPETFAYSYYNFRPVEHNLVSEWDFIYNKAHNEYLNLLATTGTLGLITYLFVTGASIILFIKNSKFEFLAGYLGLLVSNFFGFSVVPTQLLLFLFPAFALTLHDQ